MRIKTDLKSRFMLRSIILSIALLLVSSLHAGTKPGKLAPDFKLEQIQASKFAQKAPSVSLEAFKGKVVYLDFWASWCGPCRQSFPWMNKMQDKYGDKGLEIVAINLDEEKALAMAFLSENKATFNVLFDPAGVTPELYGVMGMPSSYLIDRNGKLLSSSIGFNLKGQATYEAKLVEGLAQ